MTWVCFFVLLISLSGCNNTSKVEESKSTPREVQSMPEKPVQNTNETEVSEPHPPIRNDGKWVQFGHRLYYIQGVVKSIQTDSNGSEQLTFLVEKTYQSGADGVMSPYTNGEIYSFLLKDPPKIDLSGNRIIIYGGQVTPNDQDSFEGAQVVYRQVKGTFVDFNGKAATLPPTDFPNQF
jgi:hypothetical protein